MKLRLKKKSDIYGEHNVLRHKYDDTRYNPLKLTFKDDRVLKLVCEGSFPHGVTPVVNYIQVGASEEELADLLKKEWYYYGSSGLPNEAEDSLALHEVSGTAKGIHIEFFEENCGYSTFDITYKEFASVCMLHKDILIARMPKPKKKKLKVKKRRLVLNKKSAVQRKRAKVTIEPHLEIVDEENEQGLTCKWHDVADGNSGEVMFPLKPEKKKFDIIDNEQDLKTLCDKMMKIPAFAYDTETNTLDVCADSKAFRCADITISWGENNNYDILVGKARDEDIDRNIDLDILLKYLKPVFEREDVLICGANLKYDMHVLRRLGITIRTKDLFDVELAAWLCDENDKISLKFNSGKYMKVAQTKFRETTDSIPKDIKKQFGYAPNAKVNDFTLVSVEDGAEYCTDDSFYTWCLMWGFMELLEEEQMDKIYYKRMIPFMTVLLEMEERGISVDRDKLERMQKEMGEDLDSLQYQIYEIAGVEFNIKSSQQLCEILYGTVKKDKPIVKGDKLSKAVQKILDDLKEKKIDKDKAVERLEKQNIYIDDKGKMWRRQKVNHEIVAMNFGFPILAETKGGAPSVDKHTLARLTKMEYKSKRKQKGVEMCNLILQYSKLEKLKGTFADGILEKIDLYSDGKCHPNFRQVGTDSGRISCIEENQLVKCVGEDKPIKDVCVGDLVYCYDNEGKLRVRKVLNVFNNGVRPCIKVNYRSQGTHQRGSVICTPDHRIRLASGEWVEAKDLKANDKVTHLRRSNAVRPVLYGTGRFSEQEQIVIKHEVFGNYDKDIVIHHKDLDKSNNKDLSNLELMTRSEHTRLHTEILLKEGRLDTESFRSVKPRIRYGEEHPSFIHTTAEELEKMVREAKGIIREIPMDFNTFKKKCEEVGFDYKKVAGEYQTQYRDVSDEDFIEAFFVCEGVPYAISRYLNIGRTKVANKIKKLDLCYNHRITGIQTVGMKQVYDLEVEEFHNFIASEICVHNCANPNLQQLPKADEEDKYQIRDVFIGSLYYKAIHSGNLYDSYEDFKKYEPKELQQYGYETKRKKILAIDYHNLEMVCLTYYSHDKNLTEMFANDDDAHGSTAVNMFQLECTPTECKKEYPHLRQAAKTINFMLMYGGGAQRLYEALKYDPWSPIDLGGKDYLKEYGVRSGKDVAQCFIDKYFASYSGVAEFIRKQKKMAHRQGYVWTILGRKRRLPDIYSRDKEKSSKAERLSVNATIQGTAGDITSGAQIRLSTPKMHKYLDEDRLTHMLLQVHDELVYEFPEEYNEEIVKAIKYYMEHPFGDKDSQQVPFLRADYDVGNSYQEAK